MPTLEWIGKNKVVNHHQEVPFRVLERQYSFDEQGQHTENNDSENMIIHGDNLEALKALLPQYEGKVKCIYIVILTPILMSILSSENAFITKPYNTAILLAKIASLLKKAYPAQQQEQIVYGDAVLHLESSSLGYNGQSIELTKNELKILYYLFKNGGKICSRGDIIEYLWDNQLYVDDNALSVNINRIREKLASIGLTDFIKTKHRQGYTI